MSVIRPRPPEDPLVHAVAWPGGNPWLAEDVLESLGTIRQGVMAEVVGLDRPTGLLEEYRVRRPHSLLFAILAEGRRIRDSVDRLVVVSGGSMAPASRLVAATCSHPFHDQLPRGERGGRPRLTWLDAGADNDRVQGLLDLVAPEGRPRSRDLLDQWAVLAVDSGTSEEAIVTLVEILAEAIGKASGDGRLSVAPRLLTVARNESLLARLAESFGCQGRFHDATEVDASFGVFTSATLLPAAVAGIDIVRLLEGAAAMLLRFMEAPVPSNPVLVDAACRHHAARELGLGGSAFVGGGPALAELSAWARHVRPAAPDSAALVTRLVIQQPRREEARVPPVVPSALPSCHVTIGLPRLDEHALGQLLQLLILSTAVEKRMREAL